MPCPISQTQNPISKIILIASNALNVDNGYDTFAVNITLNLYIVCCTCTPSEIWNGSFATAGSVSTTRAPPAAVTESTRGRSVWLVAASGHGLMAQRTQQVRRCRIPIGRSSSQSCAKRADESVTMACGLAIRAPAVITSSSSAKWVGTNSS